MAVDLHWLAESEQLDALREALAAGADLDARDEDGRTPLHVAVVHRRRGAVEVLLDAGADVEAPESVPPGYRALHRACLPREPDGPGDEALVGLLVERGADVAAVDERGTTALHLCVAWCRADLVERLVERGARVGANDRTGRTPLHVAVQRGAASPTAGLLGDDGELAAPARGRRGETALDRLEDVAVAEVLLLEGADPNAADRNGVTPLHLAAARGTAWAVRALLDHGASPSPRDEWETTPLHRTGAEAIVEMLRDAGAEIDARDREGATPLHRAVGQGHGGAVERLVAAGADLEAVDAEGRTPLHLAAAAGRGLTVDLLLDEGANPKAKDADEFTPLDLARAGGHEQVAAALKRRGGGWRRRLPFLGGGDE